MLLLVSSSSAICTRGAWARGAPAASVVQGAFVTAPADPVASAAHAVAAAAMSLVIFVIAVLLLPGRAPGRPAWRQARRGRGPGT